jgi:flagellin
MAVSGVINTNLGALFARNALNNTAAGLNRAIQELSTGLKINSPADNPAGYAIAQRFTTQLNGMNQAISNANQAVSLVQTATGAIQQQTNILQKIRTIAVQAANGSNSVTDRQALQNVVGQLTAQVNTIAQQTQFNGQNILNGNFSGEQFQIGANANQILNISIANASAKSVGVNETGADTSATGLFGTTKGSTANNLAFTGTTTGGAFTSGNITIAGSTGTVSGTAITATESAQSIATSINAVTENTGVSATARTSVAFTAVFSGSSIGFNLGNGTTGTQTNTVNITATNLSGLISSVNNHTATTGISAGQDASGKLVLTQSNGANISITGFTGVSGAGLTTVAATGAGTAITSATASATGLFQGLVTAQSTQGFSLTAGASGIGLTSASSLHNVSSVNVGTVQGANKAISIVDFAISALNQQGGQLGAIQNRIQSITSNLQTAATNLTAARSTVQDANIAQVTSQLTREQILQQAGISTLAQANALQQSFLKLLP